MSKLDDIKKMCAALSPYNELIFLQAFTGAVSSAFDHKDTSENSWNACVTAGKTAVAIFGIKGPSDWRKLI